MRAFMTALIVALGMALPASVAGDDDVFKLEYKGARASGKGGGQRLKLEITTTLPESVILNVDLSRVRETFGRYHMVPTMPSAGGGLLQVKGKKFVYEPVVRGPGRYEVVVLLMDEFQKTGVVPPKIKDPRWKFTFDAWDESVVPSLGEELRAVDEVLLLAADLVRRLDEATAAEEELWRSQEKALTDETDHVLTKVSQVPKGLYPASLRELESALRVIRSGEPFFLWKEGKFAGPWVYKNTTKLKTNRGDEFTFKNFARYMKEVEDIAGREFCLWVLKEARRSKAPPTEPMIEQIRACAGHLGVAPFTMRLEASVAGDLDGLENEIRTLTPLPPEQPPAPGEEKKEGDGNVPPPGGEAPGDKKDEKTDQKPDGKPEETKVESKEPVKEPAK